MTQYLIARRGANWKATGGGKSGRQKWFLRINVSEMSEKKKMRTALIECRQYIKHTTGSWWNDSAARELMVRHINPALGLDAWSNEWIETDD